MNNTKKAKKVICFGEIMARLNPEGFYRIRQADKFCVSYAGAEANVAVSLANYGEHPYLVSKVPAHDVGQSAVDAVRKYGVDTTYVLRGGSETRCLLC